MLEFLNGWRIGLGLLFLMFAASAVAAFAVEGSQVEVHGGSVHTPPGTVGTLDLQPAKELVFQSATGTGFRIPYDAISSFAYHTEVAQHMGVLPALGVALVRKRERKHLFRITWKDDAGTPQTVVLEVAKHAPEGLLATLAARAPQACTKTNARERCGDPQGLIAWESQR